MRHLDHRPAADEPGQAVLQLAGAERVEMRGRLVQQQQRRIAQECPGQRDALALTGRQLQPAVAERRV